MQKATQLVESHRAPPCQTPVTAQQLLVQISSAVTCSEADGSGSLSALAEKFKSKINKFVFNKLVISPAPVNN